MLDESGKDAEFTRPSDTERSLEEVSSDSAIVHPNLPDSNIETGTSAQLWAHYKFIVLFTLLVPVAVVGEKFHLGH
jgi:hypothetical protein